MPLLVLRDGGWVVRTAPAPRVPWCNTMFQRQNVGASSYATSCFYCVPHLHFLMCTSLQFPVHHSPLPRVVPVFVQQGLASCLQMLIIVQAVSPRVFNPSAMIFALFAYNSPNNLHVQLFQTLLVTFPAGWYFAESYIQLCSCLKIMNWILDISLNASCTGVHTIDQSRQTRQFKDTRQGLTDILQTQNYNTIAHRHKTGAHRPDYQFK